MVTGTGSVSPTMGSGTPTSPVNPAMSPKRASDNRRSNKPIMEKRRRARINNCLNELKTLILDAMKKDPARHSKLEKADILEMTVKHLQNLQRQQAAMSAATDPTIVSKFRAGFTECAGEVGRFPGIDVSVKRRLLQHLSTCLNQGKPEQPQQVQVHIIPSPGSNPEISQQHQQPTGIILSHGNGTGLQLVPTRLPNGDIALVLPSAPPSGVSQNHSSPLPLLVPIPTRTASTSSSASTSTSYSLPTSPEPMDVMGYSSPPMQRPLSLVVRKVSEPVEEEQPWRPW